MQQIEAVATEADLLQMIAQCIRKQESSFARGKQRCCNCCCEQRHGRSAVGKLV